MDLLHGALSFYTSEGCCEEQYPERRKRKAKTLSKAMFLL